MTAQRRAQMVTALAPVGAMTLLLTVWEIWVRWRDTPVWFFPAPSRIGATLWNDRAFLLENALVTLEEVVVGLGVAIVAGVSFALAIRASSVLERTLYPIVVASQAIPVIALAPLLLIWFGHGLLPKVIMTALIAFFPITVATADGLRAADRELLDLFRAMGADRLQRFFWVQAPGALPSFFSGLRVAVAVAVIGAVIGEFVGSDSGLGHTIVIANASLRTDLVFACVALLAAMAVALFVLVALIERVALPWRKYQVEQ
ncbi:ABC transporter permease [soil metagenome]